MTAASGVMVLVKMMLRYGSGSVCHTCLSVALVVSEWKLQKIMCSYLTPYQANMAATQSLLRGLLWKCFAPKRCQKACVSDINQRVLSGALLNVIFLPWKCLQISTYLDR